MSENRSLKFESVEELIEFFDSHDMGEYFDELPEVSFDVNIKKRTFLLSVDKELMKKLSQVARTQNTSTEELVNSWLEERVAQAT